MKMRHLSLSIIMTMTFVGSGLAFANTPPPVAVAIPVTDKESLTVVTPISENDTEKTENFFRDLRQELEKHERSQQPQLPIHPKVTLKNFASTSASFAVAIAAVQMESLLVKFSDNPRALQDHLESLEDPIGHFAFYMFMVANGLTSNYLMKAKGVHNMEPLARVQALRAINYSGMAVGSLASSLTAEVAGMVKECSKIIFAKEKEEKLEKLKVCDSALDQWKRSTKAQQYTAQIISLIISNDAAQIVEMRGRQAVSWTFKEFAKDWVKKDLSKASAGRALQVIGVQLAKTASGGTVLRVVGRVAQFAGFTYIDHLIAAPVQKAVANLWQPINFDLDVARFNDDVFLAKESLWKDDKKNLELAQDMAEMTKTMGEWRQAQLTKFQMSHSIWVDSLIKVIDQTMGTFGFYKSYLENLFATKHVTGEIEAGRLPPEAMNHENNYPYRLLPLFGVKLAEALPADYESERDLYLNKPSDLEGLQIRTVQAANTQLKAFVAGKKLHEVDSELLNEIIQNLDSKDLMVVGQGLVKINDVLIYNRRFITDAAIKQFLLKIRTEMGNPYPILTPGMAFTYAYETHSFNTEAMKKFPRKEGSGKWLPRTSDYLMLQMICGGENEVYKFPWGFAPYFIAPKIVDKSVRPTALCNSLDLRNLHSMKIETTSGQTYKGLNDVVSKNIRKDILGDVSNRENKKTFTDWWYNNVNTQLKDMYRRFDTEYVHVLEYLTQNWQGYNLRNNCSLRNGKFFTACLGNLGSKAIDGLNQSDYLDKDALTNLSFELDIYVSVLNEMIADIEREGRSDEVAQKAKKDFGGFLRRLKAGDPTIIKGQMSAETKSLMAIRDAIRARLLILAKIEVKNGVITNFPDKAVSLKTMDDMENALKAFQETEFQLSQSQKVIFDAAVGGIQSVMGEITGMNMAFYATKYKMEESYEDVMRILKGSQSKTPPPKKPGANPFGG